MCWDISKKNEKILMIADSALELLIAIQVKISLLREIETIIVIPNRTNNAFNHYELLKETRLFDDVIFVDTNNFPRNKDYRNHVEPEKSTIFRKTCVSEAKEVLKNHKGFTRFFTSEIDFFSQYMYQSVMNTATPYIIGEGVYVFLGLPTSIEKEKSLRKVYLLEKLKDVLYYGPNLKSLNNINMIQIPSIHNNIEEFKHCVNHVFEYIPHKHVYKNKIIVFEENFITDGGSDEIPLLINELVKEYGSENILLKRHPRSKNENYMSLGVETIDQISLPWEIISMNGDCDQCVLLAINSNSVLLSQIWDFCSANVECAMLNKIVRYKAPNLPDLLVYYSALNDYYEEYGVHIPQTYNELIEIINNTGFIKQS